MTSAQIQNESIDTKNRILEHALRLFSEKGFEATSIRNLASEANVNIAAINYHFTNKENLYISVVEQAHRRISEEIKKIAHEKERSPEELVVRIFDHLIENGVMLIAVFKVMLSSGSEVHEKICNQEGFEGPPGVSEIAAAFQKNFPHAQKKELISVVRSLFSMLLHNAIIASAIGDSLQIKLNEFKPTIDDMRSDLIHSTRVLGKALNAQ